MAKDQPYTAQELLAARSLELLRLHMIASSNNQFLFATELAERALLLAELSHGKCLPDQRANIEKMKQFS